MRRAKLHSGRFVGVAVAACAVLWAQQEPRVGIQPRAPKPAAGEVSDAPRQAAIRIDTSHVQINVTVLKASNNQVVTGMEKDNFELFEDKIPQEILSLSTEEAPLSIAMVFDISGSMGSKLARARQAAAEFFRASNEGDEYALITFGDAPKLAVSWTSRTAEIQSRMAFIGAKGRTALYDGIYLAMQQMKTARNARKAILILSDGGDNNSRYGESDIRTAVREADVQIYGMGIYETGGRVVSSEELAGPSLLGDLAEITGGRSFNVDSISQMPDVAAKIGVELRNQYMLTYSSTNKEKDGKYRRVEVKVKPIRGMPQLKPYFRNGYYAPTQ